MKAWLRRWWWPTCKVLLALAILLAVGWRFYFDLQNLDLADLSLQPGWMALAAFLYILALGFSAWFWRRLLWSFGERPGWLAIVRAYYVGHLGKYIPGKAWALLLRSALIRGPDVRLGVAAITAFYEVLTTMASGALLAAGIFMFQPVAVPGLLWGPVFTGLFLLGLVGVPLLPGVFNLLVARLAARFQSVELFRLPPLRTITLVGGLLATGCGWLLLGASLFAVLQAVLPDPPTLTLPSAAHLIGSLGLAYVAGFLAIVVPGGVGVREFFLLQLLMPLAPEPMIAVSVLLLRVIWTAAELIVAGIVYWLPAGCCRHPLP